MVRTRTVLTWAAGLVLAAGAAAVADEAKSTVPQDAVFKANALFGIPFRNANNETLGKLTDLMVDDQGQVVYGVLSHGGVVGVGDKLFAVPPEALKTLGDVPNHPNRKAFVLSVSKATLDTQPGFNEKDYPTAPDPIFEKTDKGNTTVRRNATTSDMKMYRLKALEGTQVRNQAGEDCGKVRDFGVNLHDAKVVFVEIGYGGTARVGEKYFAFPWKAAELKSLTGKPSEVAFVVRVSKQTLDSSPGFGKNGFPGDADLKMFVHDGVRKDEK
jgi:sporulation protein YlmC with PRC-barrel domain